MKYLISYDLDRPGQKYHDISDKLRSWGARQVLCTQWVGEWAGTSCPTIAAELWKLLDGNDRLIVVEVRAHDARRSMNAL